MTSTSHPELNFDEETRKNIDRWLNGHYDQTAKEEIHRLLKENLKELIDAFYTTLAFGTGGLRGIMGVGSNRMNVYTVGAMIQGFCNYLNTQPTDQKKHSVLIGYDSRHHSKEFAEGAAKIFAGNGIKALLFKEMRPSPLASFGCRFKKCSAAIMFTASHNPPEYNGCKIFWNDGGQVVPPHDKNIIAEVNAIEDIAKIKQVTHLSDPLIEMIDEEIDEAYYDASSHLQNYREDNQSFGEQLKIVYTSLHGTGIAILPKTLQRWGFPTLHYVKDQIVPDGNFPTTSSVNPEDPAALTLGISQLQEMGGDLLIAHDPDGDRVSVAVLHRGHVKILTGNQIAALLIDHVGKGLGARNKMPANGAFIKTVVTTELFAAIADYYQKPCFNVLPGFKYIAEKIRFWEGEAKGRQFVLGAEESCGYLQGSYVRDKDAVGTSALICEMALQAKLQGKTLIDFLHELYHHFGIYEELVAAVNFSESKEGRDEMEKCFEFLQRRPPKKILDLDLVTIEDYRRSIKIDLKTVQNEALPFPKSNLLLFWLSDGSKLAIRPSGTEPKIKFYCGVKKQEFASLDVAIHACQEHAKALIAAVQKIMKREERI